MHDRISILHLGIAGYAPGLVLLNSQTMIAWGARRRPILAIDETDVLHIPISFTPCQRSANVGWPTLRRRQRTRCNIHPHYREKRFGSGLLSSALSSETLNPLVQRVDKSYPQ